MKDFLETTLGRILLGVIVLIIWGVNAFNFSQMANHESATVGDNVFEKEEVILPSKVNYEYTPSSRDPFMRSGISQQENRSRSQAEQTIYIPEITLNGIFGKTIMITTNGNEVVFMKAGEFLLDGIMLKRIYADSVHLEVGDDLITLTVNE